ncbi:PREDICTED: vitamin K-dependent gamma-carboxylase isoform X2 [Nicrophorus vespilloides]|uniref:Vitamin K-dependent gamma-carboxylase isoform X2 n=1 Tax=Nicrophorus vespilloides TaxID=110193 RepID=A0ABM1ND28_NICVS|nr:PREDICTED: vitamin K-dependent gamma-carboxylase isoform X2 [Nicrophorus vespilloides]
MRTALKGHLSLLLNQLQVAFKMENINWKTISFTTLNDFLHKPKHAASLAVARILFGMLMLIDIVEERGGSDLDIRWGDAKTCHFPLLPHLQRPTLPWMCLLYGIMWLGALGIALGYKFKLSCAFFCVPYWYVLLLDKSFWNNHSYLYGLIGLLLFTSSANCYWSLDSFLSNDKTNAVPNWNYFILKFQIFILYFYAGLKKTDMEWLDGYSMANLGHHWIFSPFSSIFTVHEIDYLIIHMSGFLLDLSLGFLLVWKKTRPLSILAGITFHLMNSRMFSIGMFPYVSIATIPLFCEADWPIKLLSKFVYKKEIEEKIPSVCNANKKSRVVLIMFYCLLQMFLPYSHFITKGFNNWTNGLYGYSWDMMVHSWDTTLVVVRIVDNKSGKEHFLDPSAWTHNDRWSKHADMCVQYAHCLKNNLLTEISKRNRQNSDIDNYITSQDISIYVDVWCSLNGRFQQRMFNPNYDLLKADWSPFKKVEWLLPLLTEYSVFRETIREIENHVYTWSNYSDVLFIADFPGLSLENFISPDLDNVTLTVIEGEVVLQTELNDKQVQLVKGSSIPIVSNVFHTILTVGERPSCFMYTYFNKTKDELKEEETSIKSSQYSPMPLLEDSAASVEGFVRMWDLVGNSILNLIYQVPMIRRAPL